MNHDEFTHNQRRRARHLVVAVAIVVPLALAVYGVASAAIPGLSLTPGQSAPVTCSGGSIEVSPQSATSLTVNCEQSSTNSPPPVNTPPAGQWWSIPTGVVSWQWVLNHPFDVSNSSDLGTDDSLADGSPAPTPTVYDIDAIINPASTVAALHARGAHVICYIESGSAGDYYSASQEGIPTTYYDQLQSAGVLGNTLPGYPQERFVNITSPAAVSVVEAEINQQCAAKGFDAVETDLDETYTGYDGSTGFPLTESNEQTFLTTIADYIHSLGLGWIAKNLVDTGDNFATVMEPLADGLLTENCNQWNQCGQASTYIANGKGVLNAEYNLEPSQFCPADDAAGINGARIDSSVDGYRIPCR